MRQEVIKSLPPVNLPLCELLLDAFFQYTRTLASATAVPRPHVLASAIFAIVSPVFTRGTHLSSASLSAKLVLLCHHPLIVTASPLRYWRRGTVEAQQQEVVAFLTSENGLLSEQDHLYRAALFAVRTLVKHAPDFALDGLIERLLVLLDRTDHDRISKEEIAIFRTPEGQLYGKVEKKKEFVPQVVESKNVRRDKADRKLYKGADAEWEKQLRAELEKKKKGDQPEISKEEQEAINALLAKESAIRHTVAAVYRRLSRALVALRSLAEANPAALYAHATHLPRVYPAVLALLPSGLVDEFAAAAVDSLALCCGPSLLPLARLIAVTTVRYCGGAHLRNELEEPHANAVLESLLNRVQLTCRDPLPASAFAVVFPLIKEAIVGWHTLPGQDAALALLELHSIPGPAYPRAEMGLVIITALENPRLEVRVC